MIMSIQARHNWSASPEGHWVGELVGWRVGGLESWLVEGERGDLRSLGGWGCRVG